MSTASVADRFFALLDTSVTQGRLLRLVLARPQGAEAGLQRVTARPLQLRGQLVLSFVYRYDTRDETKNLPLIEAVQRLRELVGASFRNAHLFAPGEETQLKLNRKGTGTLTVRASATVDEAATANGAETQVSEFVALEHTSKNKMILAVKRPQPTSLAAALAQVREIEDFYGIREQCLETLLMPGLAAVTAPAAQGRGNITPWLTEPF